MHGRISESELRKAPCFGGLDLSERIDLTALSLVWRFDEYRIAAEWYWMPERSVTERTRKDKVPYNVWVRQGWIEAIPGRVVDARVVEDRIKRLADIFQIQEIAFDKAKSGVIAPNLADYGLTMIEFGQTAGWFDDPTRRLIENVLEHRWIHEDNPVSKFCASCLSIKRDENEKIKPVKPNREESTSRIDGIVARLMALDRAERCIIEPSPLSLTQGFLTL